MKRYLSLSLWFCWSLLPAQAGDAPVVLKSTPANHATGVSVNVGQVAIVFDRNMKTGSHSLLEVAGRPFPPMIPEEEPWRDPVTFVLKLKPLQPNTRYAFQLNSARRQGFVSAEEGKPLAPTVLEFTTGGAPTVPTTLNPASPAENRGKPASSNAGRPPCPTGWTAFKHPLIGMEAYLPTNYWVRLRGGVMLTVEKQDSPTTMAFLLPFRPKAGAQAAQIAEHFARFVAESDPQFRAQIVGQSTPDRALSEFRGSASGQAVQGKYLTLLGASGSMAFVIGVSAAEGKLESELPVLKRIAQSFAFVPAQGRWTDYQSPAGGMTMTLPEGWQVKSGDGQSGKDNIDWVAMDPKKPLSRVFQWCPRYCSPSLLQDPLHAIRGYQAGQFANHEQLITTSLGQLGQGVQLLKLNVNQQLTTAFRKFMEPTAQQIAALGAGQMDIVIYDCLAKAQADGQPVLVALLTGIQTLRINGGIMGQLTDLSVTLRGWCAEPGEFVNDSPVLEKVCASMQLTPAFLRRITQGNEEASRKIRETYAYMNKIDDQIRQSRWDTMDAIAEMNYDNLRSYGGYVNESTGRIEQIPQDQLVKNSRGEYVSREEVQRGVAPDSATVLRDAYSGDYMRGVYGRVEF